MSCFIRAVLVAHPALGAGTRLQFNRAGNAMAQPSLFLQAGAGWEWAKHLQRALGAGVRAQELCRVRTSRGNWRPLSGVRNILASPSSRESLLFHPFPGGWAVQLPQLGLFSAGWCGSRAGLCLPAARRTWEGSRSPAEVDSVWTLQFHLNGAEPTSAHLEQHTNISPGSPAPSACLPNLKYQLSQEGSVLVGKMEVRILKVKKFCLTFRMIAQKNYFLKLINHVHSPHTAISLPKQIAFIVKTTNLGIVINTIVLWAVRKGTWRCSFAWLCRNKDWSALLLLLYRSWADSHTVCKAKHSPLIPLQNHKVNSFSSVLLCKLLKVQHQLISYEGHRGATCFGVGGGLSLIGKCDFNSTLSSVSFTKQPRLFAFTLSRFLLLVFKWRQERVEYKMRTASCWPQQLLSLEGHWGTAVSHSAPEGNEAFWCQSWLNVIIYSGKKGFGWGIFIVCIHLP